MKLSVACFCLLLSAIAFSQGDTLTHEKLVQLKKSKTVLNKYVNFDVLKLMIGPGRATSKFRNSLNASLRLQLLMPVALSKRHLKIAYGITYGCTKIKSPNTDIRLKNGNLLSVTADNNIRFSKIRTHSVGIIALRVIRLGAFTLLAGPSLEYNIKSSVKAKSYGKDKQYYTLEGAYNKIMIPLNLQLSISRKQFAAFGFFGRYDLNPLFKSQQFNNTRNLTIGVSGSLII